MKIEDEVRYALMIARDKQAEAIFASLKDLYADQMDSFSNSMGKMFLRARLDKVITAEEYYLLRDRYGYRKTF